MDRRALAILFVTLFLTMLSFGIIIPNPAMTTTRVKERIRSFLRPCSFIVSLP